MEISTLINTDLVFLIFFGLIIFIIWAEALFYLAGRDKKLWFGLLYALGVVFPIGMSLGAIALSPDITTIIVSVFILLFLIFVGVTVYEQAGNKDRRWYYLTLIFPVLALVYQFTKKR